MDAVNIVRKLIQVDGATMEAGSFNITGAV